MISNLLPYKEYKESGVDLLGRIPTHWHVRRLRWCVKLIVSTVDKHSHAEETPVRLCNYTDVYKNSIIRADHPFMVATATSEEIVKFRLRAGDVIITKDSEDWRDIGVPSYVAEEADDLICGYHLAMLRSTADIYPLYLHFALQSRALADQFSVAANGVTRYGLPHVAIKDVRITVPPFDEQKGVAKYLLKIDRHLWDLAIAYRKMVGAGKSATNRRERLLDEFRSRIISDIVCGQLDVREAAALIPEVDATTIASTRFEVSGQNGEKPEDILDDQIKDEVEYAD